MKCAAAIGRHRERRAEHAASWVQLCAARYDASILDPRHNSWLFSTALLGLTSAAQRCQLTAGPVDSDRIEQTDRSQSKCSWTYVGWCLHVGQDFAAGPLTRCSQLAAESQHTITAQQ